MEDDNFWNILELQSLNKVNGRGYPWT